MGSPFLDQNGFRELVVAIKDDVPKERGSKLIAAIKDLLTETSEMMYLASMQRFYIHDVRILTPKDWDLPDIIGDNKFGDTYESAAIQVAAMNAEHGEAPYTHQPGHCGEEGNPVLISDRYLFGLMDSRDEMILKYGPIGNVLTQEFAKYRYGIFEEYGYPGNKSNGELYPSTSTQAFLHLDRSWKMALVNNSCADTRLEGKLKHIEGEQEYSRIAEGCEIDQETGEITSDSCFFAADNHQNLTYSSMGSYQYTDLVTVFCDDSGYFPHNDDVDNRHNHMCIDETRNWEPMSTKETILKHYDFAYGHNQPQYVQSTVPNFSVYKASHAKFVLVLDNSGSMQHCGRLDSMKSTLRRWVQNLKISTKVAIVRFGSDILCATGTKEFNRNCFVEVTEATKVTLRREIENMDYMGFTLMSEALKEAHKIMHDEILSTDVRSGAVLLVTDGVATGQAPDSEEVWRPFKDDNIPIITLNIGNEIDKGMERLVKETRGRAFFTDCKVSGEAFQYASTTYIPHEVGDNALQRIVTNTKSVSGVDMLKRNCAAENDNRQCFKAEFTIEKSLNKDVAINIDTGANGVESMNFVVDVSVRRRLAANVTSMKIKPEIDGFKLGFPDNNTAEYFHEGSVPEEYTREILEVYLTPYEGIDMRLASVEFKFTAMRVFENDDVDYHVTCNHPDKIEKDVPFIIHSKVLRGETPIKNANVVAQLQVTSENDNNDAKPSHYETLKDDGSLPADSKKNDGIYSTAVDLRQLGLGSNVATSGVNVMCNLMESPDGEWNSNNFFGNKRSISTQNEVPPYCCGTKDQKWNIPETQDVTKLLRSSLRTGVFVDSSLFVKDVDFGPPAEISDLKVDKIGNPTEGLVKVSWTATGDDWHVGTASSYSLVYSDKRKGLMNNNKINKDSKILLSGSLEPVPAGEKMEVVLQIANLHVPGTYLFALTATDDEGKVSRPSNIARVNFHDGSAIVLDADPHLVHGHAKNDLPFDEKIRRITGDERIVQRFMALIEKNKKIVTDAENSVIEKRLKEKMGRGGKSVKKIMDKIKNDDVLRAIYKSKLL